MRLPKPFALFARTRKKSQAPRRVPAAGTFRLRLEALEERTVLSPAVTVLPILPRAGVAFSGPVATFVPDTNGPQSGSAYQASIQWGDNTTTPGTIGLSNGQLTVSGNHTYSQTGPETITVKVQPVAYTWAEVAPLLTPRFEPASAVGLDGRIYVFGGQDPNANNLNSAEVYSPFTNTWAPIAPMPTARHGATAATGIDGRIFVFGGLGASGDLNTTEAYNPQSNTWGTVVAMPTARDSMVAVTGIDSRIYVFGGEAGSTVLNKVEAYNPLDGTWSTVAPMPTARAGEGAAIDLSGKIHVYGGIGPGFLSSQDVYTSITNSWTSAAAMPDANGRALFGSTAGPDGLAYAIGGTTTSPTILNSVEAYNATSNTWATVASMPTGRFGLTAATGGDGIVYAIGGINFSGTLTTVEGLTSPGNLGINAKTINVIPAASATFTVTSAGDDMDGGTLANPDGPDGTLSLREAIAVSNLTPGLNTIDFAIGAGVQTINLLSALPAITNPVIINATPPGSFPTQMIVLNGAGAGAGVNGLDVRAGNSTVNGDGHMSIINFNHLSGTGSGGAGILLEGIGGDVVEGLFLGTNFGGTVVAGNVTGVTINAVANNTIGGTAGNGSFISANQRSGIVISGIGASANIVQGNVIGTDVTGKIAMGNGGDGVLIQNGAARNIIGGAAAGSTNLISANGGDGVHLSGAGTDNNIVLNDVLGTDVTGETALGNHAAGVALDTGASDNVIGATVGGIINLISGNTTDGIVIGGSNDPTTAGNLINSNAIGTDVAGTRALGNGGDGVHIQGGASGNVVGGVALGVINLISANSGWGVVIDGGAGAGTGGNTVDSNAIGTDVSGLVALGNHQGGVQIVNSAVDALIGGTPAGVINLIAGNIGPQVLIDHSDSTIVEANAIGTDVAGSHAFSNSTDDGVRLQNGASNNTIGGTVAGVFNIISGNKGNGITITGSATLDNVVRSNAIGTTVAGTAALPNQNGVQITGGSTGNLIGVAGAFNIISGNLNDGVLIQASGNDVSANAIGTDVSGGNPLANGGSGVEIAGSANIVGGVLTAGNFSGAANIIDFNTKAGVKIDSGASNSILGNSIFGNKMLGISLAAGANNSQPAPVLTSAATQNGQTIISGTLTAQANTSYRIEFFLDATADPSGAGQGQTYLGAVTVTTNGNGTANFMITVSALPPSEFVSATATDFNNNTSQFATDIPS